MVISAGPSASRGACLHHRHRAWAPTLSQRCVSTTGLPIGARKKPFGTSWPWTHTVGSHRGQARAQHCPPIVPLACPHLLSPPARSTVSAMWASGLGQWVEGKGGRRESWGASPQWQKLPKPLSTSFWFHSTLLTLFYPLHYSPLH